nr:hypothetical protein [Candidatus Sigynarchaeota archaeon]
MIEKEFQLDPKIVQEALKAVPRFMQEVETATIKPIQNAFVEWFQSNSPPLEKLASFKAVEQAFVSIVTAQIKSKEQLRELMKTGAGPKTDMEKQFTEYWQLFEEMVLTKCKILAWEAAGKGRPDAYAKLLSDKLALVAIMDEISDPGRLSSIVADEILKLFNELKKLAPKK